MNCKKIFSELPVLVSEKYPIDMYVCKRIKINQDMYKPEKII